MRELLRLDLQQAPTAPENQNRLGSVLGGDPAGFPNGRRPNDDVTDIVVRVVGGNNYIANHIGDGVNFLAGAPGTVASTSPPTALPGTSRSSPRRTTASAVPVRALIPAHRQCLDPQTEAYTPFDAELNKAAVKPGGGCRSRKPMMQVLP